MTRLLLVEDDFSLRLALTASLEKAGFQVTAVASAEEAQEPADIVVLDWNLPGRSGLALLQQWREAQLDVPVILLTARDGIEDRVTGLEAGADDYLVKPFATEELIARIRVQLRKRQATASSPTLQLGSVRVDLDRELVTSARGQEALTTQEAQLLVYLVQRANQVVTRQELVREILGFRSSAIRTRAIDNTVYRLRAKIEADPGMPRYLITVRGVGYRFVPESGTS